MLHLLAERFQVSATEIRCCWAHRDYIAHHIMLECIDNERKRAEKEGGHGR